MKDYISNDELQIASNDVVQIDPDSDVKPVFHGKLAIVEEVKTWGVTARIETFDGDAYIRLPWEAFVLIGPAQFVRAEAFDT